MEQIIEQSVETRGRKSAEQIAAEEKASYKPIFQREFKNTDGSRDIWFYNLEINKRGPIKTLTNIVGEYDDKEDTGANIIDGESKSEKPSKNKEDDAWLVNNMSVPKTRRKYIQPSNGKIIGYTRARMLGLID